ncbi:MAG: hypothetical protein JXR25_09435 [Pontiellaceae bacterium]|nr:hypothetical protein [Pontiellaceae bacterium]MBN2785038.1 hypothetical protein [Pontiellaceae bacterium]
MKDVPIDDIASGTILAASLMSEKGSLILSRGTVLSDSILARLRRIGVEALPVSVNQEKLEQERSDLREAIEKRFQGSERNPYLQELKRIAIGHLNGESSENPTQIV